MDETGPESTDVDGSHKKKKGRAKTPDPLAALKKEDHWGTWKRNQDGGKPPTPDVDKPWWPWVKAAHAASNIRDDEGGLAFHILKAGRSALDLDHCIAEDGTIDPRAREVVDRCKSDENEKGERVAAYCEVTPSGHGLRVIGAKNAQPRFLELNFSDVKVVTARAINNYTTVTCNPLDKLHHGDPDVDISAVIDWYEEVGSRRNAGGGGGGNGKDQGGLQNDLSKTFPLPDVVTSGGRNQTLYKEACRLRRLGWHEPEVKAALVGINRARCHPPVDEGELATIARSACSHEAGTSDFHRKRGHDGADGAIIGDSQDNVRLALERLGIALAHDTFADRVTWARDGRSGDLDDSFLERTWLEVDDTFKFRPSLSFFTTVVMDAARRNAHHPVREYLKRLEWDKKERVDHWLTEYAQAKDTRLTRAVGALVLVAAVRRVRRPGCKFDELLVLESGQGLDKSTALATLCPKSEWFADSVPLGIDAKQTIERTQGSWIVEAADLHGRSRHDLDTLKAALSRQVDGPVRLAYARLPVSVPRQFVVIGTTNLDEYLHDATGNRRFWPVRVGRFDIGRLRADRDQLWAEAAVREARGESIRLAQELWDDAAKEQEKRYFHDPWEPVIALRLDSYEGDNIPTEELWQTVNVPVERQTPEWRLRLGTIMRHLGWKRCHVSRNGKKMVGWRRDDAQKTLGLGEEDEE